MKLGQWSFGGAMDFALDALGSRREEEAMMHALWTVLA
jgi:hypothetical protein